jgi:hypothetical protein
MVHVPIAMSVTLVPSAVVEHFVGVFVVNVTGSSELAVALTLVGLWPIALLDGAGNVIVWFALLTVKLRLTSGAGL